MEYDATTHGIISEEELKKSIEELKKYGLKSFVIYTRIDLEIELPINCKVIKTDMLPDNVIFCVSEKELWMDREELIKNILKKLIDYEFNELEDETPLFDQQSTYEFLCLLSDSVLEDIYSDIL